MGINQPGGDLSRPLEIPSGDTYYILHEPTSESEGDLSHPLAGGWDSAKDEIALTCP